jgi:uncharacterized protein
MKVRLALITGASSGLGREIALLLASRNIPLLITARDQKRLDQLAGMLSVPVISQVSDLSDPDARQRVVELIHKHLPDLIINNAGFGLYGEALSYSLKEQMDILEVNANALLELSLEGARALREAGREGTIVNISSVAAFFPFPTMAVYAAAKAFVKEFSQAFDLELSPYGIRVLTCCPGQIDTEFRKRASRGEPQKEDSYSFSVKKAASLLLSQIERGKRLEVIDGVYKVVLFITRFFIPRPWVQRIVKHSISRRATKYTSS